MLDLGSPDVWPSTREKAASWEKESYVRDGSLTLWDAANLLDPEGYGGIFDTCSKAVQKRITGLYITLMQSLEGSLPTFLGYAPAFARVRTKTDLGFEYLPVFPGVAFRKWFEQNRQEGLDGRYFERYPEVCQIEEGEPQNSENPFWNYEGPLKMDTNSPTYWAFSRSKTMTVAEFVCFYCGISLDGLYDETDEYSRFLVPLLNEIQKRVVELEEDIPF